MEDDAELAHTLSEFLRYRGYAIAHCGDGESGLARARQGDYRVIVLDRMLPNIDGLTLVRSLRQSGIMTPVIFLTTMDGIDDRVHGLEAGGDDYLVKPFAFEELLARVEALSRRPRGLVSPTIRVGDLVLDQDAREVRRDGAPIDLTPKEYAVLEYLMRHAGKVMSRTLITEYAWGYHFDPGTNIVDVVINHLRKKIDVKHDRRLISTVRGVGYVMKG